MKPETRKGPDRAIPLARSIAAYSEFGIRISFGLRASDFGFGLRPDFAPKERNAVERVPTGQSILARAVSLVRGGLPLGGHARRFTTTQQEKVSNV